MKQLFFVLGLICMAEWSWGQENPAKSGFITAAGDILYVPTTVHDFGKIPQGKPVYHTFTIENRGADTLRIEHVQSSCGCTTPWYRKDPIPPGGSAELKVGYNAQADGLFDKNITIYYNGGKTRALYIRGSVWQTPIQSVPENSALKVFKQFP